MGVEGGHQETDAAEMRVKKCCLAGYRDRGAKNGRADMDQSGHSKVRRKA